MGELSAGVQGGGSAAIFPTAACLCPEGWCCPGVHGLSGREKEEARPREGQQSHQRNVPTRREKHPVNK